MHVFTSLRTGLGSLTDQLVKGKRGRHALVKHSHLKIGEALGYIIEDGFKCLSRSEIEIEKHAHAH